jgi:glycosyltransferase involved in cell wall biosynthesis
MSLTAPIVPRAVDVVVPCYNYARFLRRNVKSILDQHGVEVRVLIIDDASGDETPEVGEELAVHPCVAFRRHAKNLGHIATYNEGILGWAAAKYTMLLSADDWLTPGALMRAVDLLEDYPDCGFVFGFALIVADQPPQLPKLDGRRCILAGEDYVTHVVNHANPVPTPTVVVRTALQQKLGGYRAELPHSGDMEIWLRFAAHGSVGIIRDVQAYYSWHGQNMGRDYYYSAIGDLEQQEAAAISGLNEWSVGRRDIWLGELRRRLAQQAFWLAHQAFDAGKEPEMLRCLEFSKRNRPDIVDSRQWLKLRLKRAIGRSSWSALEPLARKLRGLPPSPEKGGEHFGVGKLTGWGPSADPCWSA